MKIDNNKDNNIVSDFRLLKIILVLTLFSTIFIIPIISAVEFEMNTEFDQGETLLAKISGNFLEPITAENVFFHRGHVRIPMVYDVKEIEIELVKLEKDFLDEHSSLSGESPKDQLVLLVGILSRIQKLIVGQIKDNPTYCLQLKQNFPDTFI